MLNKYVRVFWAKVMTPFAKILLRLGVSPDAVTLVGTAGVCFGALAFFPRGEFFWGTMVVTLFVFSDAVDGLMARMLGRSSNWGAFLDSSLDRVGDIAVFGGVVLYYAGEGDNDLYAAVALLCLGLGSIVSYVKARAEGLGWRANVGIAERADRLVLFLVTVGIVGLGVPEVVLLVVMVLLAAASAVTVLQRVLLVRQQALAATPPAAV